MRKSLATATYVCVNKWVDIVRQQVCGAHPMPDMACPPAPSIAPGSRPPCIHPPVEQRQLFEVRCVQKVVQVRVCTWGELPQEIEALRARVASNLEVLKHGLCLHGRGRGQCMLSLVATRADQRHLKSQKGTWSC